jgi:hypothetical protein
VPIVGVKDGEGPVDPMERQTLGDDRVSIDIIRVVAVHEFVLRRPAENSKGDRGQHKAEYHGEAVLAPGRRASGAFFRRLFAGHILLAWFMIGCWLASPATGCNDVFTMQQYRAGNGFKGQTWAGRACHAG